MDVEKEADATTQSMSNNSSTIDTNALINYQARVGDIYAPVMREGSAQGRSLYHTVLVEERSAALWYYVSAPIAYFLVAGQIILSLAIVLCCREKVDLGTITVLASASIGVAVAIGVMKGCGFPENKKMLRLTLQELAAQIRDTTGRLEEGLDVDVHKEVEVVKAKFESSI